MAIYPPKRRGAGVVLSRAGEQCDYEATEAEPAPGVRLCPVHLDGWRRGHFAEQPDPRWQYKLAREAVPA